MTTRELGQLAEMNGLGQKAHVSAPVILPVVASLTDGLMLAFYLARLSSQTGTQDNARVSFIVAYLVLVATLSITGAFLVANQAPISNDVVAAAGCGNLGLGLVALASFGIPLIAVGALLLLTRPVRGNPVPLPRRVVPGLAVLLLLVVGLTLTG